MVVNMTNKPTERFSYYWWIPPKGSPLEPQVVLVLGDLETVEFMGDMDLGKVSEMKGGWVYIAFPAGVKFHCVVCGKKTEYGTEQVQMGGYYCSYKCEERYLSGN